MTPVESANPRVRSAPGYGKASRGELAVRLLDPDPFLIELSGGPIAQALRLSNRREFVDRLFSLQELKSIQFDFRRKRVRLTFFVPLGSVNAALEIIAGVVRQHAPKPLRLEHEAMFLRTSDVSAIEVRRFRGHLTFWRIDAPSSRVFYIAHPLLRNERARRAVVEELGTLSDSVQRVIPLGDSLMVFVRPFRMEAEMFPEMLDPVLTRAIAGDDVSYSPRVQDTLVNANLALAPIADLVFPPAGLVSAGLTGALIQKSVPLSMRELSQGKVTLHSLNVLIGGLTVLAFEFLPAAVMYWFSRFWSRRTQLLFDVHKNRLLARYRQRPPRVWIEEGGVSVEVSLEELSASSLVTLSAGDIIPVDGIIVEGQATISEQLITGIGNPAIKAEGESVFAATQLIEGTIKIRSTAAGENTAASKLTEKIRDVLLRTSAESEIVSRDQANRAVVPTLGAAAVAMLTGGLGGLRAALRPDFLTGPAIAEEMAGLTATIHAVNGGVIWGERRHLDILRTADYYVFDDSVSWSEERSSRQEFRTATQGLGDPVLFTALAGREAEEKAARLGFRHFRPASTSQDIINFLEEQRRLGQSTVYIGDSEAEYDVASAAELTVAVVSPPFLTLSSAPLALLSPDLGKFGLLLNLAWQAKRDSEKAFRLTVVPNAAAIAAAIILRSPAIASVVLTNIGTLSNFVRSAAILQLASAGGSRRKLT